MPRVQDVTLGANRRLRLRKPGEAFQEITGRASGTGAITATDQQQPIPIPGGEGVSVSQLSRFVQRAFGLRTMSTPASEAVFRDTFCQRLEFEWYEKKTGRKAEGEAVVGGWALVFGQNGVVSYAPIRLVIDGDPTITE